MFMRAFTNIKRICSAFKKFIDFNICYTFHLSNDQMYLIDMNRYVKCDKCGAEYFELNGLNKDNNG